MIASNIRHMRAFLAVAETGSITQAAAQCFVSQPAVTQAIAKLEAQADMPLLLRTPQGIFLTEAGQYLQRRVARAIAMLDAALVEISPRLPLTATRAQLQALIAACEVQNFSLAARKLGIAQPTVHRAITQLEREAGRALFQRSPSGIAPTRQCAALARSARLAFVEFDQADAELGDLLGREVGEIVVGSMPLARSYVLPRALAAFRDIRPLLSVRVLDGPYDELLGALRRGEIDFLIGALRFPAPIEDIEQEVVFFDDLVLLAGAGHPLTQKPPCQISALQDYPFLVSRKGTPTRDQFEAMFTRAAIAPPRAVIETGSLILMRETILDRKHLACVSRLQARTEIAQGLVQVLPLAVENSARPIGITTRAGWTPTPAQKVLIDAVRAIAKRDLHGDSPESVAFIA
ncbi:HTH-type transcriptional regulator GbpR [Aquimixticola soesokkakensis]|uniref:HTH-type transcriptional regulator GbpR n=1 Tax=Aquimixticola soesokkakensis TaxID=1519096 RepID=A0A1Y5SV98_9RHOB|nr:LysR family transcriptional regulator [Aquimixticola soesokkakensis]SLN49097.1 HTH-type transcriptional regulator GbpR [Aquimixticola soesokkakensis]